MPARSRHATEPRNATITYPGGLRARWRWGGSGSAAGGLRAVARPAATLIDLGPRVAAEPGRAVPRRAPARGTARRLDGALRVAHPRRAAGAALGHAGLLVVAYGFHTYGLEAATGEARWDHRSATPIIALLGSSRLAHVIVQSEIETFAIEPDGTVAWRVAHSDVVTAAELVGGRLVLTGFDGQVSARSTRRRAGRATDAAGCVGRPTRHPAVWTDGG